MRAAKKQSDKEEGEQTQKNKETSVPAEQDELEIGDRVLIKHHQTGHWNKEVEVVKQRDDKLSYVIKDDVGQILVHGRQLLKPKPPPLPRSDRILPSHVRQQHATREEEDEQENFSTPFQTPQPSRCAPKNFKTPEKDQNASTTPSSSAKI